LEILTNTFVNSLICPLCKQLNKEIVKMQRVTAPAGQLQLQRLVQSHVVIFTILYWPSLLPHCSSFELLIEHASLWFLLRQEAHQHLCSVVMMVQDKTGSNKGKQVLSNWEKYLPLFWQLVPPSEEDTPEANAKLGDKSVETLVAQPA
jgi:glutamate synthase (ferredoxin)